MKLAEILNKNYPNYDGGKNGYGFGGKMYEGYLSQYEQHLPKQIDNFLEIGIWRGESISMFRDYYQGNGNFHAMNMNWNVGGVPEIDSFRQKGFICYEGDQGNIEFLKTIDTKFDVIVEDGSHHSDDQIVTFKQMFLNNVKSGGVYVLEDLHCCLEDYWYRSVNGYENTMLALLKRLGKSESIVSQFFTQQESDEICSQIDKLYLYEPSIAFIFKK